LAGILKLIISTSKSIDLSIVITGSNSLINLSINWKLHQFVVRHTNY